MDDIAANTLATMSADVAKIERGVNALMAERKALLEALRALVQAVDLSAIDDSVRQQIVAALRKCQHG